MARTGARREWDFIGEGSVSLNYVIEEGIRPLVDALNRLDFAGTVYSCEGHFDAPQKEKFLPTAYVTFSVNDAKKFGRLYERIRAVDGADHAVSLRLTYDCVLGRYTLSLWPHASLREASRKRVAVDSATMRLSDVITRYAERSTVDGLREGGDEKQDSLPCGEPVPPCMLVIPSKELICPFRELREERPGTSGE